jgi:hypothetical protein
VAILYPRINEYSDSDRFCSQKISLTDLDHMLIRNDALAVVLMHAKFPKCAANIAGKLESRQPTSPGSPEPSQLMPEFCAWGHVVLRTARRGSGKQQATRTAPCRSLSMHSQISRILLPLTWKVPALFKSSRNPLEEYLNWTA